MTFVEKTELLINKRGTIKAMLVEDIGLKVDATFVDWCKFWDDIKEIPTPSGATIWFMSGSYAIWDRYGKYWDYIVVPAIPKKPATRTKNPSRKSKRYSILDLV